ncbi:YaaA family protein [Campylobacter majalis]|uniref:YaaA family protein n=1 Tax=Campylobacter majalis TaxID=2790656 RepID=UPI003D69DF15
MKILFAPSEAKSSVTSDVKLNFSNFLFPNLSSKRQEILDVYVKFLKNANDNEIAKLFGLKFQENMRNFNQLSTIKALKRYTGVAFEHLKYNSLSQQEQDFLDKNVIIFSNLFGPILGGDMIPEYKLKQGEKIGELNIDKFYNKHFSLCMDEILHDEFVLDLRAGYYEKFYKIKKEHYTFKFIKDKKVVSHYAKAYRGVILKEIAKQKIKDEKSLLNIKVNDIKLVEIKKIGLKNEILCEIL